MNDYKFTCNFCGKRFVRESWYLKHKCEKMRRDEEIRTPIGQAAWNYYQYWFTKNRKNPRNINTFLTSGFYKPFIKFSKHVCETSLPEPKTFINFMINKQYDPHMWLNRSIYNAYLIYLDRQSDPWSRIVTTIKTIQRYCYGEECEISEIFDKITPPELIHKIYSRDLSPWILLHSPKFLHYYKNKIDPTERIRIDSIISIKFWVERFDKNPDVVNEVKNIIKRLNL